MHVHVHVQESNPEVKVVKSNTKKSLRLIIAADSEPSKIS